jgi:hypothetical protein
MAGRKLTKETWDLLVEGFRKWPSKWTKAGKVAGVHHSTAKRAWMGGLPSYAFGQIPIHRIIGEEQALAKQALNGDLENIDTIADGARARAIQVRIDEGRLTAAARANVIELLESLKETSKGFRLLNVRIAHELERVCVTARKKVALKAGLGYLRNYSHIMLNVAHAGGAVIDMENKLLGSGEVFDEDDMTLEECAAEIAEANAALARLEAKGKLTLVHGGKT